MHTFSVLEQDHHLPLTLTLPLLFIHNICINSTIRYLQRRQIATSLHLLDQWIAQKKRLVKCCSGTSIFYIATLPPEAVLFCFFNSILWAPSVPSNLMSHFWNRFILLSCLNDVKICVPFAFVLMFSIERQIYSNHLLTAAGGLLIFYDTYLLLERLVWVM